MLRSVLLVSHIACGLIGIATGVLAFLYRKGGRRHRAVGNAFTLSMLWVGATAAVLASYKHQTGNVFGGCLTVYLIATGWLAGRGNVSSLRWLNSLGLLLALAIGLLEVRFGWLAAHSPMGLKDGYGPGVYLFFGTIVLLAAVGDARLMLFGLERTAHLARHLWRMCFGLFIATGSFFLGQQQVLPTILRNSWLLFVLGLFPLPLMIFWLIGIRIGASHRALTKHEPSISSRNSIAATNS